MKGYSVITAICLLFVTLSAAWPWPDLFEHARDMALLPRQDNEQSSSSNRPSQTSSGSNSPSATDSAAATTETAVQTNSDKSTITSRASTGRITGTVGGNRTRTTAIDPRLPPGGISMITPAAAGGSMTFVKVGNQVTFVWNYTSLSVPPSYIDVVATNTINSETYTIAANQTYEPTGSVVWDTEEFTKTTDLPFVVATYTLMIYDSDSNPTAIPSAGYLAAFNNYPFGIYTPQPYVPLNEFRCATCNGAMSMHEKQALSVLLGTSLLTFLSFTWFAVGFGVF